MVVSTFLDIDLKDAQDLIINHNLSLDDLLILKHCIEQVNPRPDQIEASFKTEFQLACTSVQKSATTGKGMNQVLRWNSPQWIPKTVKEKIEAPGYALLPNKTQNQLAETARKYIAMIPLSCSDAMGLNPQTKAVTPGLFRTFTQPNCYGQWLVSLMESNLSRVLRDLYTLQAQAVCTETLIAATIYEKQNGKFPDSLDQLVPDLMEAVPIDPFDGKPLRYLPIKKLIYSIGIDLKDSGGSAILLTPSHREALGCRKNTTEDIVWELPHNTD